MAASLSRPDPSSPASVAEAGFSVVRRGYQSDEVRAFLVAVAAELGRLQERERALESELRRERTLTRTSQELDEATVTELLGEETVRVLQTARESAALIRSRAEESAARILGDAHDEANRLRQETELETARRRNDAVADAEAEVALAKQQGREMVNEARAYRERVLADLERRTSIARQQIEDLLGGRDRLLQAFERARLVAIDVTSSLQSVELPDETVNLTPTTGPVPMMVRVDRSTSERTAVAPIDQSPDADSPAEPDQAIDGGVVDEGADGPVATATVAVLPVSDDDAATDEVATDDLATEEVATDDVATDEVATVDVVTDDVVTDDLATGDVTTDDAATDDVATGPDPLGNVVSLFRGREVPQVDHVAPAPTADESSSEEDPLDGLFARLRSEIPDSDPASVAAGTLSAAVDDVSVDDVPDPSRSDDDPADVVEGTPFERRDETLVPLIVAAARKMKRVLADEQNLVLDSLRQRTPHLTTDQLLPGPDDHLASYSSALDEELAAAMVAGAAEVGFEDDRALRARLAGAGAAESAIAVLRSALIAPLRDRIERAVFDGDGDNEAITQRVRSIYREWKTQHIDAEVDDVLRAAFCGGLATAVDPGTAMVWIVDPAAVACPECEDNSLSEPVPAGSTFPTGHVAPPTHPGCRCLVLPAD
ncbi:MAG: DivIVA domain-containing protein [Ilumatobacteraceae bacterium]